MPPSGVRAASTLPLATEIEVMPGGVGTASKAREDLDGKGSRNTQASASSSPPCRRRRIRVGFLSAFFYTHSVGLLVEGVVTRLDRRRFETTAIFLQPHPRSASPASSSWRGSRDGGVAGSEGDGRESSAGKDHVYDAVRTRVEHVLDVPLSRYTIRREHCCLSLRFGFEQACCGGLLDALDFGLALWPGCHRCSSALSTCSIPRVVARHRSSNTVGRRRVPREHGITAFNALGTLLDIIERAL